MRLIDADEFKEDIVNTAKIMGNNSVVTRMCCEAVDERPTAYDVDKVVEQLEAESAKYSRNAKYDTAMAPYHRGVSGGYRFSVGIVKRGLAEAIEEKHPAKRIPEHKRMTYQRPVVYDPAAVAEYVCDNLCWFSHNKNITQEELEEICDKCNLGIVLGITKETKDTTSTDPVSDNQEPWKSRIMERFTEVN